MDDRATLIKNCFDSKDQRYPSLSLPRHQASQCSGKRRSRGGTSAQQVMHIFLYLYLEVDLYTISNANTNRLKSSNQFIVNHFIDIFRKGGVPTTGETTSSLAQSRDSFVHR